MSTLTLGIVVIIYMFILAWLGYIGYKQTKNASDYLLGGRKVNPQTDAHKSKHSCDTFHTGQPLFPHRPLSVSEGLRPRSVWESNGFAC